MDFLQLFQNVGLEDKEPDVYLALIKLSGSQPASIVASHTGLNRTTVYKTLIKLCKMGLATKTMQHGITCFYAENPEDRLEKIVMERKKRVDQVHENLIGLLPSLKELERKETLLPKMKYYEGIDGVKRVYEDTLLSEEVTEIYAFENTEFMTPEMRTYIFEDYIPRRAKKNIFIRVITPKNKTHIGSRKQDKIFFRETRFFSTGPFPLEIEINIYGNKTALFSYKEEEMFGAILESAAIANSMKAIFDFCWKFSK